MFLHLSVILFTGGCLPRGYFAQGVGFLPRRDVCPGRGVCPGGGRHSSQADTPPGQTPRADPSPGRHLLCPVHAGIHLPPCTVHAGIQSTSGRYVSYWNAYLLLNYFNVVGTVVDNVSLISKKWITSKFWSFHYSYQMGKDSTMKFLQYSNF